MGSNRSMVLGLVFGNVFVIIMTITVNRILSAAFVGLGTWGEQIQADVIWLWYVFVAIVGVTDLIAIKKMV